MKRASTTSQAMGYFRADERKIRKDITRCAEPYTLWQ